LPVSDSLFQWKWDSLLSLINNTFQLNLVGDDYIMVKNMKFFWRSFLGRQERMVATTFVSNNSNSFKNFKGTEKSLKVSPLTLQSKYLCQGNKTEEGNFYFIVVLCCPARQEKERSPLCWHDKLSDRIAIMFRLKGNKKREKYFISWNKWLRKYYLYMCYHLGGNQRKVFAHHCETMAIQKPIN